MTLLTICVAGPEPDTREAASQPAALLHTAEFRRMMTAWTAGVTVTTARHGHHLADLVSNSFASVLRESPLVVPGADETAQMSRFARKGGGRVMLVGRVLAVHGPGDQVLAFSRERWNHRKGSRS